MRILLAALLLLFPLSANAQDYKTILDIPEGATLVSLSASEQVEVAQDLLVANLQYQSDNTNPKALQDEINALMKKAVEAAKKVESVKVSTQQYYVYEITQSEKRAVKTWRGNQGLQIKGKKSDELLELTGKLQEMGLTMSGLSYSVSPELLEETRESLLEETLLKLKSKAERTAKALGKTSADILQINVDMGGYYPQVQMMRGMAMNEMAMDSKMAAPVAEPGESQISLTVSAQALLK